MEIATTAPGRPADRSRQIVREIRDQIVAGELSPGSQLPTRSEIESHYGSGPMTVQRAVEQLKNEGFVEVNGRQGTFVTSNPPHLTRYAIVFPQLHHGENWGQFWTALHHEIVELEGSQSRPDALGLPVYDGIDGHIDTPAYLKLVRDLRSHLIAGLIFVSNPYQLVATPIMREPGVPRVAILYEGGTEELHAVTLDGRSYMDKALTYLTQRGRRRVAIIAPRWRQRTTDQWMLAFTAHGIECAKYRLQTVHTAGPEAARNCAHVLMELPVEKRPDGLIIADDNLVHHATLGLMDSGVRVPEELDVIAHCNFPLPTPSAVPVRRLGYDARKVIAACIESIDGQRGGDVRGFCSTVPAVFDDEIDLPGGQIGVTPQLFGVNL